MRKVVKLQVVDKPAIQILSAFPAMIGSEDTDLVCGNCGIIIAKGLSVAGIRNSPLALAPVMKCRCGANNALPTN